MGENNNSSILIGVVGPCASGKTTLIANLLKNGWKAKHIAQEHSYVLDMWKRVAQPDVLIYLDVTYPVSLVRRHMDWSEHEYEQQLRRLRHARQYADLVVQTDQFSPDEVYQEVVAFLEKYLKKSLVEKRT